MGLFEADERGECAFVNQRLREMSGLSAQQASGWGWTQALQSADRARLLAEWNEAFQMGAELESEIRFRRPDGKVHWCMVRAVARRDPEGRVTGYLGAVIDIHDRHEAEDALRQSEQRYRALVERSPDGIVAMVDNIILFANPAAARLLGVPDPRDLVGRPSSEFVHPDSLATIMRRRDLEARGQTLPPEEIRIVRHDGTTVPVEYFSVATEYAGQRARQLVVRDVSERKQAAVALEASQARLRALLMAVPDLIFLLDRNGAYVDHHAPQPDNVLPCEEEIRGRTVHDLLPPGQGEELLRLEAEARRTGSVQMCHLTLPAAEGPREFEVRVAAVDDERWLAIARDITDARRAAAESALLARRMEEAQRLESLGVLAGGIAHDFNNILTAILGFSDLALLDLPAGSSARDSVERISSGARAAAELTRQLLAYSGKGLFAVQPVRLADVVTDMRHLLEISAGPRCSLRTDLATGVPAVEADPAQLRQVILNLVLNAAEALEGAADGNIALRVYGRYCDPQALAGLVLHDELPAGNYVVLEVEDTGCGMSPATRERMFEPFFSTKFPGRGLGLAAVLGIVRSHRGTLDVTTEVGRGTTVRAYFPASQRPTEGRREPAPRDDGWQARGLALVVDDEAPLRQVAGTMLTRMGFEVVTANDGLEALECVRRHGQAIRVVLLDLTMPRYDGRQTLRELQASHPGLPVVLSSGYHAEEGLGLDGAPPAWFARKPYRFEELRQIVRAALDE